MEKIWVLEIDLFPVPVLLLFSDENLGMLLKLFSLFPHLWNMCHNSYLSVFENTIKLYKMENVKSLV